MAATGACFFAANWSPLFRRNTTSANGWLNPCRSSIRKNRLFGVSTERIPITTTKTTSVSESGRFEKEREEAEAVARLEERSVKDYFEQSKELIRSDGGPPRWFSPLDCGAPLKNSPLLLYLPGIDGSGLGLIMQHQRLGEIFEVWCLHIPVKDRTSFTGLIKLVQRTITSESYHSPNRPIYLVGESLGGCLALAVAACNPDIDLALILANPATSFSKSQLQSLTPLLEVMPEEFHLSLPLMLSLMTGDPLRTVITTSGKGLPLRQTVGMLSQDLVAKSSYLSVLADMLPKETLLWKLQMLKSASAYANSCLHAVKAQTLILSSGTDQLLPSQEEGERLLHTLPKCDIRKFKDRGHFLFLEDDVDLVYIIKAASFYRHAIYHDYVSDFIPPSPSEAKKAFEAYRLLDMITCPVMLSTLEDGKIVKGLAGIPSEGPVLFVGYHMLLGIELGPMIFRILSERNILVRGIAHPVMFTRAKTLPDLSSHDAFRVMGAVPVSAANFYNLLSSKSHVLLYPGGMREALHRKGEEYKLFWPEQSEFVRMATRFGAKIVPFGVVGEDDIGEVFFDYDDLIKIPYFKDGIEKLTEGTMKLRVDVDGEVANQDLHVPGIRPKFPGRFYFHFGKPIETKGRKQELIDREKSRELYLHVKSEVERSIDYLRKKRENDPYRNILTRLYYQATHGFTSEAPSFEI